MLEPSKARPAHGRWTTCFFGVRGLKWRRSSRPRVDAAKYGLDNAGEARSRLYRGDGTVLVTLMLGKKDGDRLYVQTKSAPAIYAVDARQSSCRRSRRLPGEPGLERRSRSIASASIDRIRRACLLENLRPSATSVYDRLTDLIHRSCVRQPVNPDISSGRRGSR